jgi:hypothetical protein
VNCAIILSFKESENLKEDNSHGTIAGIYRSIEA